MSISLAGGLVFLLTIFIIVKKRTNEKILIALFSFNLFYEGFINVGYFMNIGSQTFKVADYLQLLTVFFALTVLLRRGMSGRLCIYIIIIFASVIALCSNPLKELVRTFDGVDFVDNMDYLHYPSFDLQTIKTSLRLICFAINVTALSKIITYARWKKIKQYYFKIGRFVIIYGWIEFILKNFLNSSITEKIIFLVLGSDTSVMTSLTRNGFRVIIGFNNEPSQFAMMLYSYLIIYIISKEWENQSNKEKFITLSALIQMILCGSFRPVAMIPVLILMYLLVSKKPAYYIIVAFIVAIALNIMQITGMLDYYMVRLTRAFTFLRTLDTSIGGGEAGRLNTIVEAFQVFLKRPLLGIGPGQTFAYGFIPSMLAMTGMLGLLSWYSLIYGKIGRYSVLNSGIRMGLIVFAISFSWVYTDSIAIGYSIYVIGIVLSIRYSDINAHSQCRGDV